MWSCGYVSTYLLQYADTNLNHKQIYYDKPLALLNLRLQKPQQPPRGNKQTPAAARGWEKRGLT